MDRSGLQTQNRSHSAWQARSLHLRVQLKKKPKPQTFKPPVTRGKATGAEAAQVVSYRHLDKRKNNPEVGMVTPSTDPDAGKTRWAYDPHLDPELNFDPQRARIEQLIDDALESGDQEQMKAALEQLKKAQSPYLNWAGKAERTSFEVDTVSLHVHERIDPASILSAVRKRMKAEGKSKGMEKAIQPGLFDAPFESLPLRDAIDFYRHERGWANRLIAGDSLLVMNSLSMAARTPGDRSSRPASLRGMPPAFGSSPAMAGDPRPSGRCPSGSGNGPFGLSLPQRGLSRRGPAPQKTAESPALSGS